MISLKSFLSGHLPSDVLNKSYLSGIFNVLKEWEKGESFTFQSSGSTGKPKNISFSKAAVIASCEITRDLFKLQSTDLVLCPLHPDYVAGKMMILRALVLDLDLWLCEPNGLANALEHRNFDFVPMVPVQLENLLGSNAVLPKKILLGGSPLSAHQLSLIKEKNPTSYIAQGYGMTETLTHIALRNIHPNYAESYTPVRQVKIDKSELGTLKIKAPHIKADWIVTNDLAECSTDGTFKIVGRKDLVINSGAHKVNPMEVEDVLRDILDQPYFVHGLAHPNWGQEVVLILEGNSIDLNELIPRLKNKVHKYALPKKILTTHQFKRSAGGKIMRAATIEEILNP